MQGFIEFFNRKFLAENRRKELLDKYDYQEENLKIFYEASRGKWILIYEP